MYHLVYNNKLKKVFYRKTKPEVESEHQWIGKEEGLHEAPNCVQVGCKEPSARAHRHYTGMTWLDPDHPCSKCVLCTPPDKNLQDEKAETTALEVT